MASSVKTQWVSVILFLTIFLTLLPFCTATAQSGGLSWSLEGPADAVVAHDGGFLALVEGSIWACRPGEQEPALLLPPDGGLPVDGPVSYTHLDVYKRQHVERAWDGRG